MSNDGGQPSQQITDNERSLNLNSGRDTHIAGNVSNVGGDQITHNNYYSTIPLNPTERQNRANLMINVRQTWIEGFLKQSLYTEVRLELGKTYEPAAVSRPWQLTLHQDHAAPQPIPPEQPILDIYRQAGSNLLILGEPGSGKTMTLLMLAESLLAEAEADEGQPVPVVLNLSSWALRPVPLQEWLVESLHQQYQLSKQYAGDLLTQQRVTLLLDGLDEVAADQRPACAEAVNAFKAEQQMSVVVCSRVADYENMGQKLNLSHAIRLQPLSQTQIDAYLAGYDPGLSALRQALPQDEALQELAQTPLMLAVMTLAYRDATPEELTGQNTPNQRRAHIFDRYIEKMFARRPLLGDYTQTQAHHWLSQLAFQMFVHTQSIYYMELMQPTWLSSRNQADFFQLFSRLPIVIIGGLLGGLFGIQFGSLCAILGFFVLAFLFAVSVENKIVLQETIQWVSRSRFKSNFQSNLGCHAVFMSLFAGGMFGSLLTIYSNSVFGFLIGIIGGLSLTVFFLGPETFVKISHSEKISRPNHDLHATVHKALLLALFDAFIFAPAIATTIGFYLSARSMPMFLPIDASLTKSVINGSFWGLIWGAILGFTIGFLFRGKGYVIVQHYVLRGLLARHNILPFPLRDKKLIAFLDDMAAHIFLRRVGGGWVFIHRSLLEHFAAQVDPAALGWENWSGTLRDPADLQKEANGSPER